MGDHKAIEATNIRDRASFIAYLLNDISSLEYLVDNDLFEKGITRIGAEQEFCLVNQYWRPSKKAIQILNDINDHHFTTELGKFNLEVNLDPLELGGHCFSQMHERLNYFLSIANQSAKKYNHRVVLAGILPSISINELTSEYMTSNPRYNAINESIKRVRGGDMELHLKGVDEIDVYHDSVLFEACNTSFQMHLQVPPEDFVASYNWALAISGALLGLCTNSPLLLGRELWHETRIALFQQSIDTRKSSYALRDQEARVSFGNSWAEDSVVNIYKNDISRFKILLSGDKYENSLALLEKGEIPNLSALNLFNGTVYRWNRACYGVGNGKAHLRIENRYIPSGPSTTDEIANFMLWVGLMIGRPKQYDQISQQMDFRDAKSNFINAARSGKNTILDWFGKSYTVCDLMKQELIPIAWNGLVSAQVEEVDIKKYLNVIEKRMIGNTGSSWLVKNYRQLRTKLTSDDALRTLTKETHCNQTKMFPVHLWPDVPYDTLTNHDTLIASHIMSTEIFSINENDQISLASRIMTWNDIHHIPVESSSGKMVGLLTWSKIVGLDHSLLPDASSCVKDVMITNPITINPDTAIDIATEIMKTNKFGCLPVVNNGILVGLITKKDLVRIRNGESKK